MKDDEEEFRHGGLAPLAGALRGIVRPLLKDRPHVEAGLLADWADIVGPELAALARPLKLRFDRPAERREGVLELACETAAALEVQHRSPELLQRVNAYLGYPAVARLRLRQRPLGGRPRA